jgi:hypothetical protein
VKLRRKHGGVVKANHKSQPRGKGLLYFLLLHSKDWEVLPLLTEIETVISDSTHL